MSHFQTDPVVLRAGAESLATARAAIDAQVAGIVAAGAATTAGWRGAGGTALRSLLDRYEVSARTLQAAVARMGDLMADQAGDYLRTDEVVVGGLSTAGSALRL